MYRILQLIAILNFEFIMHLMYVVTRENEIHIDIHTSGLCNKLAMVQNHSQTAFSIIMLDMQVIVLMRCSLLQIYKCKTQSQNSDQMFILYFGVCR